MTAHEEHPISVTGDKNNSLFVSIPGLDFSLFKTKNFSNKHNISIGTVTDLIAYRLKNNTIVERVSETNFHDYFDGNYKLLTFKNTLSNEQHYALVSKKINFNQPVCVRMHKHRIVKDILTEKNFFDDQMKRSVDVINKKQNGVIVIINGNYAPRIEKQFSRQKNDKFEFH